jgi:serine/threonine protein kinase
MFIHPTSSSLLCYPCFWKISVGGLACKSFMAFKTFSSSADSGPLPFKYVPIEEVERLEKYQPGGYHPILIGDILRSRYRVAHKLGYGAYSTTWLCRDYQSNTYVAVKVGTADSNDREVDVLNYLNHSTPLDHPGRTMIPSIKDRFVLHGPNGTHPCYVTTLAMCSVSSAKEGSYKRIFQAMTARSLIVQLLLAVEYIHSKGVVHGDLHIGNILLCLPADFDQLSIEELYEKYGSPASEPVIRFDGQPLESSVPSSVVPPIWLGKASEEFSLPESRVLLSDFGEAYRPSTEYRYNSHAPMSFVPPEARFESECGLSFSADIWTLACSIWIILGQRPLFEDILATPDDITAEQIDTRGNLPPRWWEKWAARHKYFDESGKPNQGRQVRSWEDRFEKHIQLPRQQAGIQGFDLEERAAVMNMLRSMLSFEPEKRPTAQDIVKCEWMERWAIPDFNKSHLEGAGAADNSHDAVPP